MQRLLGRFRAQGFVHHDLSRACLAQVRGLDPARRPAGPALPVRRRAERLHEESSPSPPAGSSPTDATEQLERLRPRRRGEDPGPARRARSTAPATDQPSADDPAAAPRRLPRATSRSCCRTSRSAPRSSPRRAMEKLRAARRAEATRPARDPGAPTRARSRRAGRSTRRSSPARRSTIDEDEQRQLEPNMRAWQRRLEEFDGTSSASRSGSLTSTRCGPARRAGRTRLPVAGDELTMAKLDPQVLAHLEWLGFVQPRGLVVSAPALVRAGALLDRRDAEGPSAASRVHRRSVAFGRRRQRAGHRRLPSRSRRSSSAGASRRRDTQARTSAPLPAELEVPLPEYGETLRPDFAVRELEPGDDAPPWQLLVQTLDAGHDLDTVVRGEWPASRPPRTGGSSACFARPGCRRPARQRRDLRLVSAPRGESSGWLDFPVAAMVQTAGRPISPRCGCCSASRACWRCRGAAPPSAPRREPQVPERRLDRAGRAGARRAVRAAPRLPGGPRRVRRASFCGTPLAERPGPGLPRAAHRAHAAGVPALRRGPRAAARRGDVPSATTRSPACSSGCARTPRATPTRWTSATAPGRSC